MLCLVALAFAFVSLFAGSQIYAAPTHEIVARQLGNLQCNLDRLSIVASLAATQGTVKKLTGSLADNSTAAGIQAVTDALSGAESAIATIGKALFTGATAPADARDVVKTSLDAAHQALSGLNSTDTAIADTVKKALTQLENAQSAGEGVVSNCK
ncbi:hypothetical protein BD413DRAFT_622074 [Trametes elegans]|nr:hypothetical protein BD413DRAFT_622074 [Trametes elegans]